MPLVPRHYNIILQLANHIQPLQQPVFARLEFFGYIACNHIPIHAQTAALHICISKAKIKWNVAGRCMLIIKWNIRLPIYSNANNLFQLINVYLGCMIALISLRFDAFNCTYVINKNGMFPRVNWTHNLSHPVTTIYIGSVYRSNTGSLNT